MKMFTDKRFFDLHDDASGSVFSDLCFVKCRFERCVLSNTIDPRLRSVVKNVEVVDCHFDGHFIGPAIVEDALIENLSAPQGVQTSGAVFKHVILRGRFGRVIIGPLYPGIYDTDSTVKAMNQANERYYDGVDWALDIRDAEFTDGDIRNIRTKLIRRDPTTQAVVRRENVVDGRWMSLDLDDTHWGTCISDLLESGEAEALLLASKRANNFRDLVKGIELLRSEGIADPD